MKLFFNVFLVLLFFGLHSALAQSAPQISYTSPNNFTIGETVNPLIPKNTGSLVSGYEVSTFAGSGTIGSSNGTGISASFYVPQGMLMDPSGNILVMDVYNHKIRKITPEGIVSTFAGTGMIGSTDGNALAASFNYPNYITVDALGTFYVSDAGNHKIRKITPEGIVSTFAGSGVKGKADGTAKNATFFGPGGLVFDRVGNLYVSDFGNCNIRKITPDGIVTTIAGTGVTGDVDGSGLNASFSFPLGITIDDNLNLYVADTSNKKIRKITPEGMVSTFAGSGKDGSEDGTGIKATFRGVSDLVFDQLGNLLVTDTNNNTIRKISPAGVVSTFAGSGGEGSNDGPAATASIYGPAGIIIDHLGELYVSTRSNTIRKIALNKGKYTITPALPNGLLFDPETGIISGTPTVLTTEKTYTVTAENEYGSSVFTILIAVNDIPPKISYGTPNPFFENEMISPLNADNTGGRVLSYSVSPSLPSGLLLNSITGSITGTPLAAIATSAYTISASNSGGTATFTIEITIEEQVPDFKEILVSEAITPNGDNINDTWVIKNIENYATSFVQVFNRWGELVFSARNYQNDWDGHLKNNSQSLPESSSYYYQIDLNGDGSFDKKGWIYINR